MTKPAHGAKILLIDIETFPNQSFTWGKYDQNVVAFEREGCLATFAAKWLHKPVFARALPDYRGYRPNSYDDGRLVRDAWRLLSEADVVVAHNGDNFDFRVLNARFIVHGLKPPAPYKTIDTKKIAKSVARFNSNKLDDLGETLGLGRKLKTEFDLWLGCIRGEPSAWARMVRYNKRDVVLLESLYLRLLPYIKNHPNLALYGERIRATCPKCGGDNLQSRGYAVQIGRRYRRAQCQDCGGWLRELVSRDKVVYANI